MRPIPVMLALLLALSPGAVALQAPAPTTQPPAPTQDVSVQNGQSVSAQTGQTAAETGQSVFAQTDQSSDGNTTNVMTLGTGPDRTALAKPSLALGSALASDYDSVQTQLSVNSLDQQLEYAGSNEEKKQLLNRYRYRIENRIISLQAREERVTNDFQNGTVSKQEYLRTLGQIDVEVDKTQTLIETMRTRADSVRRFNMDTETNTLLGELVTLEGPVRDHIGATLRGQRPQMQVYVATAETGVVLSTIVDDEYVREVIRTDRRNPDASDRVTMREVDQAMEDQYSWTYNNRDRSGIDSEYGTTNVYRMWFDHVHGRLVVYYDGGTESVFKEVQHKRLFGENSLPPGPSVNNTSENLTLAVNRTYPGGPLRAELTNASGAPLQGEISIDGDPVGRTSDNGVLWTLGPAEQFRVTATYDDRTVNVTTTPTSTTPSNVTVEPVNVTSLATDSS